MCVPARQPAFRSVANVARAVVVALVGLMMLYMVFRMGMQFTGGFAPSFVTNAWGGPTAVGAFLAHGLGALAVWFVCLAIMDRVLLNRTSS